MTSQLDPPNVQFPPSSSQSSLTAPVSKNGGTESSGVSLTVNYLPHKFSNTLLSPGPRKRKGKNGTPRVPKRGGGVEAFRSGEARVAGENDEDYDGVSGDFFGAQRGTKKLRWNKFKWVLFVSNTLVSSQRASQFMHPLTTILQLTIYSIIGLIMCLLTWFNIWVHADIIRVANRTELVISTLAASMAIFVAVIGWAGILLNNRTFLAIYTFLLWIVFIFLLIPGYLTYKRRAFNLEGKVNAQWSRDLGPAGRLRIQNQLGQLAEQYGSDVATEIIARSRSNLQLDVMPTMPYSPLQSQQPPVNHGKYDSIGSRAPETAI
ncbi:hypothetical protein H0H93_007943 [Arthromyces matolae]|nr:hypothetical protein H0H93_007943 [Arthromyces matolae]